jgi:hypothetical protein
MRRKKMKIVECEFLISSQNEKEEVKAPTISQDLFILCTEILRYVRFYVYKKKINVCFQMNEVKNYVSYAMVKWYHQLKEEKFLKT